MPLIEVQADFKELVKAVERVAVAVETLLRVQFGMDLQPDAKEPAGAPTAEVTYSDDLTTAAQEATAELERLGYRPRQGDTE